VEATYGTTIDRLFRRTKGRTGGRGKNLSFAGGGLTWADSAHGDHDRNPTWGEGG
jgi:hypothetical protein